MGRHNLSLWRVGHVGNMRMVRAYRIECGPRSRRLPIAAGTIPLTGLLAILCPVPVLPAPLAAPAARGPNRTNPWRFKLRAKDRAR
jgi:hypothetical protein